MIRLISPQPFSWSETEQVYTPEKGVNGETLYCKEIDLGVFPNTTTKAVPHNISGLDLSKVHRFEGFGHSIGAVFHLPEVYPTNLAFAISLRLTTTDFVLATQTNYNDTSGFARVIYAK